MAQDKSSKDHFSGLRRRAEQRVADKQFDVSELSDTSSEKLRQLIHELQVHQIELELQNDELRRTQQELRASLEPYAELYDFAPVGYFTLDQNGVIREANLTGSSLLGVETALLLGKPLAGFVNQEGGDILYLHFRRVLETQSKQTCDVQIPKKDGNQVFMHLESQLIRNQDGLLGGFRTVAFDITDRKKAEADLEESERKYRDLIEGAPVGIFQSTYDGRVLSVNPAYARMFGYASAEEATLEIDNVAERIYVQPERRKMLIDLALKTDGFVRAENRYRRKDGSLFWGQLYFRVVRDCDGEAKHLEGFVEDITERKNAEESLAQSEQMMKGILSTSPVAIGLTEERKIKWVNRAWEEMFGFESQQYMDQDASIVYPSQAQYERVGKEMYPDLSLGLVTQTDATFIRQDGSIFDGHIRMKALDPFNPSRGTIAAITDITERKQAEEALSRSEKRFRAIFENQHVVMLLIDPETGKIEDCSPAACAFYGYSREELVKKKITEINTLPQEKISELLQKAKQQQQRFFDFRHRLAGGEVRDVEVYTGPVAFGGRTVLFSIVIDVTDRRQVQEALRESEEKYRVLVEKAHEAILVAQDGYHRFVNPAAARIWGYSQEELLSRPFGEFIHPDDRDMVVNRSLRRAQGEEIPERYAHRVLTKDGKTRWIEIDSGPISWKGRPAVQVFATDITERKQMEEELKESQEWYRNLVEESFHGMFVQQGSKIIFANSRLHEMLGYSPQELQGLDHWLIYHPDYRAVTSQRAIARMRGEEVVSPYEVKLQRKDGTFFDGEITARAMTVRGEPGVQVWLRDVSGRKRSELARRRLATAVEQAEETIVITDPSGSIQYVNPAFEKITGYTKNEVLGRNPSILKSGEQEEGFYRDLWNSITHGKVWRGRFINRRKDGKLYTEDATISPVRDRAGRIVNFVAVKRDVTDELAVQQQLLQAQKMEAVGTLAGGIAHDFNNLLQVTLGYSELLLNEKSPNDAEYEDLHKIHHASQSGAELVQKLLAFGRKADSKPVPLDINRQVKGVEELLRRTIPRMIDIRLELAEDLERVNADPGQVDQVIMNLVVNAMDAMGETGSLTISTENVILDEDYCRLHLEAKPGSYVLLCVSDTGQGMDKETLGHIFEPFFTTKELGRGTGLGLATVYGIIKQHGGHIICYSETGRGTTFKVYFPAIENQEEQRVQDSDFVPAFGIETILLVDDEEFVRELGVRILGKAGYQVLVAGNGREALDLLKKERTHISLVVLDLIMPEMGGRECLRELQKIDPQVKVLVASGYSADASVKEMLHMGAKGFVNKPFRIKELLRDVRRILDED
ncbi:MAG TPA: PAS domain S-box protein [Desulfomonilaceae bacterium]|nr:PAS domain S-box protein [Desulfomonilaceae bacterium]